MANSNNVYAEAKPLRGTVSDWVQNQEQSDFAYREEQRRIAALDEAKKAREKAKKDELRKSIFGNLPQNYDTGSTSLNEFQGRIILKAINRKGEIYKALSNPNLSDDERIKLEIENQNIDNLPENLQVATKNFTGVISDYRTGVSNGSYFRNPDFEAKVLNGFKNYIGGLDNGLPVVGFVDRDGDGAMDILPYESLAQGFGPDNSNLPWKFQKQVDLDKLAVATGEKLGKVENTTDSNFRSVYTKGPDLKSLNSITNNIMRNPDGTATDAALSEMKKRGLANTPDNLKKVEQIFKERVLAYVDTSKKEDVDYAGMIAAKREARQAKKTGKGKQEKVYSLNDLSLTANTVRKKGDKSEKVANVYQGNVKIERRTGNAYETFRSFSVDKDGNVIVTVDANIKTDTGNIIDKATYNSKDNADIVTYFAQRFKDPETGEFIQDVPELKEKLMSKGASKLGQSQKPKIDY